MKTKILSVLLACLMVISVLPVAAFADEPACTIVGDADHTLDNCPDAKKIEVVPSQCGDWGYTLYQCPACNDYFADEFIKLPGNHKWEVTTPEVPATCTTPGTAAVETCSECKRTQGGETIPPLPHTYVITEGNCVEGGYKTCTVCSHVEPVGSAGQGHEWAQIPTIKVEPQCGVVDGEMVYVDGEAEFVCDACGETKTVVIKADHIEEALTHHPAKAPDCTEAGNHEYWECEICGICYLNVASGVWFTKDSIDDPTTAEIEGINLEALGHDFAGQEPHADPAPVKPTCTTDGFERKTCNRCGEDIDIVLEAPGHKFDFTAAPDLTWDPDCDTWGANIWACLICGAHGHTEMVPPLGHTPFEDATVKDTASAKAPTCTEAGYYHWFCDVCGEEIIEKPEATGHAPTVKVVERNCVTAKYEFTYCANENCPLPLQSTVTIDGVDYDVTIPVANDPAVRKPVHLMGELTVDTEGGIDTDPKHIYTQEIKAHQDPTCTTQGVTVYYCIYCREHAYTVEDALGHKLVVDDSVGVAGIVLPTCTEKGYTAMKCERCPYTEKANEVDALGHAWDEGVETTYATCITEGVLTKTCTRLCGATKTETLPKHEHVIEYSVEEVAKRHPNATLVEVYLQGSCTVKGLYKYVCPDCGQNPLVVMENTGAGHVPPAGYAPIAGDCTTATVYPAYVCEKCGETVPAKTVPAPGHTAGPEATCAAAQTCTVCGEELAPALPHTMETIPAKEPTCTEPGYRTHRGCIVCGYYVGPNPHIDALNHQNMGVNYSRPVTCEVFGFIHILCPDCKGDANGDKVFGDVEVEYIIGYRAALEHNWVLDEDASYAPTCETAGKDIYYCTNGANCYHADGTVYGTYSVDIEATGHKNAAGRIFYNDCLDTEEDRKCVNENCDAVLDEDGNVPKSHNNVYVKPVAATCVQYGYNLNLCLNCMENWVTDVKEEYGKHSWGNDDEADWYYEKEEHKPTFTKTGLQTRKCTLGCGLVETREVPCLGIDFSLSIDNAVKSGAGFADSSLVAVTIKMNCVKVDVWGVRLNLSYNPDVVKYVGYEIVSDTFTVNQAAHDNGSYVTLVANTANTEDKQAQDLTIEGESDFAVVYFRIDNRTATEATFGFVNDAANDKVCEAIKADGTPVLTDIDATYPDIDDSDATITIKKFLDVNADGDVSIEDALAYYNLAKKDGYDVVADTDKDGSITLTDLTNLYDYLVGSKTYADMVALGV